MIKTKSVKELFFFKLIFALFLLFHKDKVFGPLNARSSILTSICTFEFASKDDIRKINFSQFYCSPIFLKIDMLGNKNDSKRD